MELANKLADPKADETSFRTAINRAYYAAYLTGFIKLRHSWAWTNAKSETDGVHEQLRKAFVTQGHPNISDKLAELFEMRVTADYRPDETVEFDLARNNVDLGSDIVQLIEDDP